MSLNLAFFGLRQKPFNPTPDPAFLYASPGHQEGLAHLLYGVQEHKGFILLTGEVGTGKTTLLRTLLSRLDGNTASAFVFDTTLPFEGLLEYILEDFGVAKPGESHAQRLFALNNFLIERQRAGQNTVLVLDEAQNLDVRALEQIRLLSNFETHTEKLLQIVLAGQPELLDKLNRPELRQLKQRIGLRCRILPLTADQTRDYIRTRLRIAGATNLGLFSDVAITRIAGYSGGIPRLINTVCDHCLLIGYADQIRRVDRRIVEEAIEYFEEGERRPRKPRRLLHTWGRALVRWALAAAGAVLIGGAAALTIAHRDALRQVFDLSTATLSGLAHAASSFLRQ
ncbi:MAG: AAA family ATPase [Candidatus Rokubacteria bacterium]|nr:AAA family ATPase [Candidatus Rokubacteria bacterium]